jgi:succinate dehydrogenase/fumarate reductase cytochrome b subunit
MDAGLLKALVALVPVCMLLAGSAVMFLKTRTAPLFLQLFGAACLLTVVFAHIFEALLFPRMRWGNEQSVGHYLDLGSALLGFTLFPLGYLLHALRSDLLRPIP